MFWGYGAQLLIDRALDLRPRGCGFKPHWHHEQDKNARIQRRIGGPDPPPPEKLQDFHRNLHLDPPLEKSRTPIAGKCWTPSETIKIIFPLI